jgi:hypothetical protein
MLLQSILILPELVGPCPFWVNEFLAFQKFEAVVACSLKADPVKDHRELSGLWFHIHCRPKVLPLNSSEAFGTCIDWF